MSFTRKDILIEARSWLKTPFHHQASLKGVGADCGGMVKGVYAAMGAEVSDVPINYARTPANNVIETVLNRRATKTNDPKPGDIILFTLLREPQHLGILTESGGVIHAYQNFEEVVEHSMDIRWTRRVHSYWCHNEIID